MALKFKSLPMTDFQTKFASDGSATIEGYASTFGNIDSYRDIVLPGAFKDSIVKKMPAMLYQHQTDKIAGIWDSASEDSKGLMVKGRTLNTSLGKDTAEELRSGALATMSIGYSTLDDSYDKTNNVRYLKSLELYEVSLVTFPANDKAVITSVKAAMEDIGSAGELIEQATIMMGAVVDGSMEASPELLATIMQVMQSASGLLEEPDDDDDESADDVGKSIRASQRRLEKFLRDAGLSRKDAKALASVGYKTITRQRDAGAVVTTYQTLFNQFKGITHG